MVRQSHLTSAVNPFGEVNHHAFGVHAERGGQAGSALVGLTAMTADSVLVVRVRGIPPPVTPSPLRVRGAAGRALSALVQSCGDGCAEAFLTRPTRGPLVVEAVLPNKGTVRFTLPWSPARPALGRLRAADRALAASRSFRIREVLTGGLGTVFRTDYVLAAPNRARWHLDTGSSTADTVRIGERRWSRDGKARGSFSPPPAWSCTSPPATGATR